MLYASAVLIHIWNQNQPFLWFAPHPLGLATWGVLFAALLALIRPSDGRMLTLLVGVRFAWTVIETPLVPSHWILLTLVDLSLLVGWLDARRSGHRGAEEVLGRSEPTIRTVAIITYLGAAVAKHNTEFLFGSASCGAHLLGLTAQFLPALGADWALRAAAWGTAVVETAIPVLLLVPGTRWVGLGVGFTFHMLTSFTPGVRVYDFAAALFTVWFLFTPSAALVPIAQRLRSAASAGGEWTLSAIRLGTVLAVGGLIVAGPRLFGPLDLWIRTFAFDFHGALVGSGLIALLLARLPATPLPGRFPRAASAVVALAVVVVLNPYIGGRTQGSFTMFSNLRTEGGRTNHLYLPTVDLLPFQRELLVPLASSDPELRWHADEGRALVHLDARRRIANRDSSLSLEYELGGTRYRTEDAAADPRLAPPPLLLRKLFAFRPVDRDGPVACGN